LGTRQVAGGGIIYIYIYIIYIYNIYIYICTRRTPPTPDDASRMQYRHKTCATSPGPGPIVIKRDLKLRTGPAVLTVLRLVLVLSVVLAALTDY